jgi:alanyl aminopeptidase
MLDALLAAAKASKDQNERADVLRALAQFGDPALATRALDAVLDPALHQRDGSEILRSALGRAPTRSVALDWLTRNIDALAARAQREQQAFWPAWADDACTATERAQFVALFERRAANLDAGVRVYQRSLEKIDLCLALRAAQEGQLNAFLAALK